MTDWPVVFLGLMALSLVIMATIQVAAILVGIKVARQMGVAVDDLRREIKPLSDKVNRIADDAQRASSLVVLQVERVDQMMVTTAARLDTTLEILQGFASGPIRQGAAAVAAFRAATAIFRDWKGKGRQRHGRDDDDALFVG